VYADERPFGNGVLADPLVVFFACAVAGLMTLRFLHARPVLQLISALSLAAGAVIGLTCFFIGKWFGVSLIHMPYAILKVCSRRQGSVVPLPAGRGNGIALRMRESAARRNAQR